MPSELIRDPGWAFLGCAEENPRFNVWGLRDAIGRGFAVTDFGASPGPLSIGSLGAGKRGSGTWPLPVPGGSSGAGDLHTRHWDPVIELQGDDHDYHFDRVSRAIWGPCIETAKAPRLVASTIEDTNGGSQCDLQQLSQQLASHWVGAVLVTAGLPPREFRNDVIRDPGGN